MKIKDQTVLENMINDIFSEGSPIVKKKTETYYALEIKRLKSVLNEIKDDKRFAEDGIVKTVLRNRIKQEQDRLERLKRIKNEKNNSHR